VTGAISVWIRLPFAAMVLSMQMVVKTMEGLQRLAEEGINAVFGAVERWPAPTRDAVVQRNITEGTEPAQSDASATGPSNPITSGAPTAPAATNPKEQHTVNKDLHDDMLKLVRYKILLVKRRYERVLDDGESLVHDNMDATAFTAWKIAEFIQNKQPDLDHQDKKYLRVYYEVLDRFPRERFKFEEEQIDVLHDIRDCLCRLGLQPPQVQSPAAPAAPKSAPQ
jgi:hypothetical protein